MRVVSLVVMLIVPHVWAGDTFTEAGFVGIWSKADAQTYFANVQITAKKD